jgi:hypothetical protein
MSLDVTAVTNDYEVLRRCREARSRSPEWRWIGRRRVEWICRWVFGVAPVLLAADSMRISYSGHDHGWSGVAQQVATVVYAAIAVWTILSSPGVAGRGRASGLLQIGMSSGVCLGTLYPAVLGATFVGGQILDVVIHFPILLVESPLDMIRFAVFLSWLAGPQCVSALALLDTVRSVRTLRSSPFGWRDVGWMLLGLVLALPAAVFSCLWPTPMIPV